jgi:hypothetical protein
MSEPEAQIEPTEEPTNPVAQIAQEAAIEADNSESEDAVLDRLLGIDAPAPRQELRTTETAAPAQPDPDFDRALKALQRDGVPADVIEGIKSDPSKVKEWGLKAAKRQADVDAFGAKVAESKKTDAKQDETPASVANTEDGEADADPLSQFKSIFGDEAAKPLAEITERLRSEFSEKARVLEIKHQTERAFDKISAQYGDKSPSFDEITEVAAQIGRENPGRFSSVDQIVREAFVRRAGEPKKADPRNIARPTVGKQPARPVREIDREDAVLDVLLSGGTRADAVRVISR